MVNLKQSSGCLGSANAFNKVNNSRTNLISKSLSVRHLELIANPREFWGPSFCCCWTF
jgi:hypothetical protein